MKANKIGKTIIKVINNAVNLTVLTVIMLLVAFAGYALWDSNQIYETAGKQNYAVYKPTIQNEGKSFKELQSINPEVIAWLHVYGTNINYPVTQGHDNMKYVNTNAEGFYSLSGAIFLDADNNRNFDDFNSILYGHHMEKKAMFGEIGTFSDKKVFDAHRYGSLYFNGKEHGIEFIAFIHTDAYDYEIFRPGVREKNRRAYLDNLLAKSTHVRYTKVTEQNQIILLSTCSSSSTNGRDILIGKIIDEIYSDSFINK